jgi:hypothetical protein
MEKARMTSYLDFDDSDDDSAPLTGGLKFEKSAAEKAAETAFDDHCARLQLLVSSPLSSYTIITVRSLRFAGSMKGVGMRMQTRPRIRWRKGAALGTSTCERLSGGGGWTRGKGTKRLPSGDENQKCRLSSDLLGVRKRLPTAVEGGAPPPLRRGGGGGV